MRVRNSLENTLFLLSNFTIFPLSSIYAEVSMRPNGLILTCSYNSIMFFLLELPFAILDLDMVEKDKEFIIRKGT